MADVLNVPTTEDFTAFNALLAKQAEHFAPMIAWAGKECAESEGLDGLLSLLQPHVHEPADFFAEKLKQCQSGMGTIQDKITTVDARFGDQDRGRAADMAKLFPDDVSNIPNISAIPGASSLGNFNDEGVTLKTPDKPDSINKGLLGHLVEYRSPLDAKGIGGKWSAVMGGNHLWIADKAYKMVTGDSLIDKLFKPLAGDWDRLMYLHDAYDTLGDACYTVAATLRKGSWKLGGEWKGDTGTAFDAHMFRWTSGIGGIGDGAKVVAKAYSTGYETIINLVRIVVSAIDRAISTAIKALAEEALKMIAGDAAIMVVGLGPEDPLADIAAAAWTAWRMVKIYEKVKLVASIVTTIYQTYQLIETEASKIWDEAKKSIEGLTTDISIGSVVQDVEQRGFAFEKNAAWTPLLGVGRMTMLPSATG
ncbi:hypothetical protein ABZ942_00025 [Nocardia sp. NPDC046473]|uniref:hypothetical protein n=1 Tax=Nocardia sp. NPDC046473 TaxID=3155733 RepID=UPI003411108A